MLRKPDFYGTLRNSHGRKGITKSMQAVRKRGVKASADSVVTIYFENETKVRCRGDCQNICDICYFMKTLLKSKRKHKQCADIVVNYGLSDGICLQRPHQQALKFSVSMFSRWAAVLLFSSLRRKKNHNFLISTNVINICNR